MPTYWEENLQVASLGGVRFPMRQLTRTGGRRTVGHQYPYRDGQDTEDLGRLPLKWEIEIPLFRGMGPHPYVQPGSTDQLYPEVYDALRAVFDVDNFGEVEFVDPELGPVPSKVVQHRWQMVAGERNGGVFRLTIEENSAEPFIFRLNALDDARQVSRTLAADLDANLPVEGQVLLDDWDSVGLGVPTATPDDVFVTTVDVFFDELDEGAVPVDIVGQRIDRVRVRIDRLLAFPASQEARAWVAYDAALRLGDSLATAAQLHVERRPRVIDYVVPWGPITHWELALLLYADRNRAADILRLNKIPNPLFIEAGTRLRVQVEGARA